MKITPSIECKSFYKFNKSINSEAVIAPWTFNSLKISSNFLGCFVATHVGMSVLQSSPDLWCLNTWDFGPVAKARVNIYVHIQGSWGDGQMQRFWGWSMWTPSLLPGIEATAAVVASAVTTTKPALRYPGCSGDALGSQANLGPVSFGLSLSPHMSTFSTCVFHCLIVLPIQNTSNEKILLRRSK
jgi:hypothetical protein